MDVFQLFGSISIDTSAFNARVSEAHTNMNNLYLLVQQFNTQFNSTNTTNTINAAQNNITTAINNINNTTQGATNGITRSVNRGWTVLRGIMSNLGTMAVNRLYNFGEDFLQTGFEYNTMMESAAKNFQTLLKTDMSGAQEFVDALWKFSYDTPLSFEETISAAERLIATGTEAKDVVATLSMLGDISLGDTSKFSRIYTAYYQIMGAGKLLAQDAKQLTEAGVPIWDFLEKYYTATNGIYAGYSAIELAAQNRKYFPISSEDVQAALMMAVGPGGDRYNAMLNAMDTEKGMAEKLKDNYQQAAGALTNAIFEVFKSDTIPALNEILEKLDAWATENPDALKHLAQAFSDLSTYGLNVFLDSLTGVLEFWNENRTEFNALLVMLGGIAMATGHPLAGLAMISVGGYSVWDEATKDTETQMAEDLSEDGTNNNATKIILPDYIEGKLKSGATYDDLTDDEKKQYDNAKTAMGVLNAINNLTKSDLAKELKSGIPSNEELDKLYIEYLKMQGINIDPSMPQELLLSIYASHPNPWADLYSEEDTEEEDHGGGGRRFDGIGGSMVDYDFFTAEPYKGGSNLLTTLLTAIQAQPADIAAAVQDAMSGVTITANVSTGNVVLNDGTLAGKLAPLINFRLGLLSRLSDRG